MSTYVEDQPMFKQWGVVNRGNDATLFHCLVCGAVIAETKVLQAARAVHAEWHWNQAQTP